MRGNHGDGAFAITAIKGLVQVGLFRLGGDAGGRAGTLHVDHDQGKLRHDRQSEGLALE